MSRLDRADWIGIAGTFIVIESIASMLWSQDKQPLSQGGRMARLGIGVALLTVKICK